PEFASDEVGIQLASGESRHTTLEWSREKEICIRRILFPGVVSSSSAFADLRGARPSAGNTAEEVAAEAWEELREAGSERRNRVGQQYRSRSNGARRSGRAEAQQSCA